MKIFTQSAKSDSLTVMLWIHLDMAALHHFLTEPVSEFVDISDDTLFESIFNVINSKVNLSCLSVTLFRLN